MAQLKVEWIVNSLTITYIVLGIAYIVIGKVMMVKELKNKWLRSKIS